MKRKKRNNRGNLLRKTLAAGGFMTFLLCCPHSSSAPHFESGRRFPMGNFFAQAVEDSGWDVRDEKNQPVHVPLRQAEFRSLFAETVVQLLTVRSLPIVSAARDMLNKIPKPLKHFLSKSRRLFRQAMEMTALLNLKRVIDKLQFISALFGILILQICVGVKLFSLRISTPHQSLSLPIRC